MYKVVKDIFYSSTLTDYVWDYILFKPKKTCERIEIKDFVKGRSMETAIQHF